MPPRKRTRRRASSYRYKRRYKPRGGSFPGSSAVNAWLNDERNATRRARAMQEYVAAVNQIGQGGTMTPWQSMANDLQARRNPTYTRMLRGRGAYKIGNQIRAFGRLLGPKIRGALEDKITNIIGSGMYTGHGAYESNNLVDDGGVAPAGITSLPAIDETGTVTICHREYLTDIFGPTTAFNVQTYYLNPGLDTQFPFLSQIAANYEEYEWVQLVFEYRSTTTDIGTSTTGQCGTVIMATNYNAGAVPFTDKQQMMEYAHAMSVKTTENMVHGVECDPEKNGGSAGKYVRTTNVPQYQDPKTYDLGIFQVAVANSPTGFQNYPIGELWVYYTVHLRKPKLGSLRGVQINRDIYCSSYVTPVFTGAAPFGTSTAIYRSNAYTGYLNNLGTLLTRTSNTTATITFPAVTTGWFRIITTVWAQTAVAIGAQPYMGVALSTGNIVQTQDCGPAVNGVGTISVPVGSTGQVIAEFTCFVTTATGGINNTLALSFSSTTNTSTISWYIEIEQINGYEKTGNAVYNSFQNIANSAIVSGLVV